MDITIGTDAHEATTAGGCGGACTCGGAAASAPELDVRAIPPSVRHAAVLGAVGSIPVGSALVLVAPHDPVPLLSELEAREPGAFTVGYDQSGPDAWHVRLTRVH